MKIFAIVWNSAEDKKAVYVDFLRRCLQDFLVDQKQNWKKGLLRQEQNSKIWFGELIFFRIATASFLWRLNSFGIILLL